MNPYDVVLGLKRGSCWCEHGIGNPMVPAHTEACLNAEAFMATQPKTAEARGDGTSGDQ